MAEIKDQPGVDGFSGVGQEISGDAFDPARMKSKVPLRANRHMKIFQFSKGFCKINHDTPVIADIDKSLGLVVEGFS